MKLLGAVAVCGLVATFARADTPRFDPYAYPHGIPAAPRSSQPYSGLGAESVTPELVAAYAPPQLDRDVSHAIQRMLDVRGADGGLLTTKADRMYFTWKVTGTAQVWRQDGPGRFPLQLTGGEDNTTAVAIAPDDSFVVVSRDVGGAENPGLYLMAPDGGTLRVIQHAAKVQTTLAFISDDAKSVYYTANDRAPDSYAIYRFDVKTGTKQLVFDRPGLWSVADHRGDQWLLVKHVGELATEVYRYDLAHQSLTPLLGQNEHEAYVVSFGAKPDQLMVLTDKLGEYRRLYTFDGTALVPVGAELVHDVESFVIDRQRARIYYQINENGYLRLNALDAKTLKPVSLPKLADADALTVAAVSRDGRYVQLGITASTLLPTTYVFDWQTRKLVEWRPPASPEVQPSAFAKVELESYPARDGVKIPMFVRRPPGCANATTPCPVIVEFHGGPESQARPGFSAIAQLFVEHGFVVVQPNVRGSSGYGKSWLHADDGPKRLDVITDIEDCSIYMRTAWAKRGVAPKLGVMGGSYGGYSVLIAMSLYAGAYDAGAEQVGIANLVTFLANTAPYRRILRISEYGDPVKDKLALEKLSPINYVDRIKAPLLILQGVNDPRVPVGEALQVHDALQARKIDTRLILFPDEGHGASKRANVVLAIGHELAFFEHHLK